MAFAGAADVSATMLAFHARSKHKRGHLSDGSGSSCDESDDVDEVEDARLERQRRKKLSKLTVEAAAGPGGTTSGSLPPGMKCAGNGGTSNTKAKSEATTKPKTQTQTKTKTKAKTKAKAKAPTKSKTPTPPPTVGRASRRPKEHLIAIHDGEFQPSVIKDAIVGDTITWVLNRRLPIDEHIVEARYCRVEPGVPLEDRPAASLRTLTSDRSKLCRESVWEAPLLDKKDDHVSLLLGEPGIVHFACQMKASMKGYIAVHADDEAGQVDWVDVLEKEYLRKASNGIWTFGSSATAASTTATSTMTTTVVDELSDAEGARSAATLLALSRQTFKGDEAHEQEEEGTLPSNGFASAAFSTRLSSAPRRVLLLDLAFKPAEVAMLQNAYVMVYREQGSRPRKISCRPVVEAADVPVWPEVLKIDFPQPGIFVIEDAFMNYIQCKIVVHQLAGDDAVSPEQGYLCSEGDNADSFDESSTSSFADEPDDRLRPDLDMRSSPRAESEDDASSAAEGDMSKIALDDSDDETLYRPLLPRPNSGRGYERERRSGSSRVTSPCSPKDGDGAEKRTEASPARDSWNLAAESKRIYEDLDSRWSNHPGKRIESMESNFLPPVPRVSAVPSAHSAERASLRGSFPLERPVSPSSSDRQESAAELDKEGNDGEDDARKAAARRKRNKKRLEKKKKARQKRLASSVTAGTAEQSEEEPSTTVDRIVAHFTAESVDVPSTRGAAGDATADGALDQAEPAGETDRVPRDHSATDGVCEEEEGEGEGEGEGEAKGEQAAQPFEKHTEEVSTGATFGTSSSSAEGPCDVKCEIQQEEDSLQASATSIAEAPEPVPLSSARKDSPDKPKKKRKGKKKKKPSPPAASTFASEPSADAVDAAQKEDEKTLPTPPSAALMSFRLEDRASTFAVLADDSDASAHADDRERQPIEAENQYPDINMHLRNRSSSERNPSDEGTDKETDSVDASAEHDGEEEPGSGYAMDLVPSVGVEGSGDGAFQNKMAGTVDAGRKLGSSGTTTPSDDRDSTRTAISRTQPQEETMCIACDAHDAASGGPGDSPNTVGVQGVATVVPNDAQSIQNMMLGGDRAAAACADNAQEAHRNERSRADERQKAAASAPLTRVVDVEDDEVEFAFGDFELDGQEVGTWKHVHESQVATVEQSIGAGEKVKEEHMLGQDAIETPSTSASSRLKAALGVCQPSGGTLQRQTRPRQGIEANGLRPNGLRPNGNSSTCSERFASTQRWLDERWQAFFEGLSRGEDVYSPGVVAAVWKH